MRRRLREQQNDAHQQATSRRDISGRETRRYGTASGGAGSDVAGLSGTPIALAGTTQVVGGSAFFANAVHQHGIRTNLTAQNNGTFALIGTEVKIKIGGVDVSLTRLQ